MTQDERLYQSGIAERNSRYKYEIPGGREQQWRLLRSLMNPAPRPVSEEFLASGCYLQDLIAERGIVDADKLESVPSDPVLSSEGILPH